MKRFALIITALFITTTFVFGQSQNGEVRGKVTDETGAIIVGAEVTAKGADGKAKTAKTNDSGDFRLPLSVGTYTVQVTSAGFAQFENADVQVTSGKNTALDIVLSVAVQQTTVDVAKQEQINTDPEQNASAIVLRDKDIESLPDDPDELAAALQALAGPGAGPNGGEIFIDGFSGGRLPPRDTIREIRINSNPFSSEYDRLGFGRIEILTKPGSDKLRGRAQFKFEDESTNSRNPFASNKAPFQVREFEGNLGGPIVKGRASFFLDVEKHSTDNNSLINALILDPSLTPVQYQQAILAPSRSFEFSPRFDIKINDNNTLVARYEFQKSNTDNAGLGGFDLLSRAYQTSSAEQSVRLTETSIISGTIINETRFQYIRRRSDQEGDASVPTIRVNDAFTSGGANVGFGFTNEDRFEIGNNTSTVLGKHSLKFGGRFRYNNYQSSSPNNFAGTFTFTSLAQYINTINNVAGFYPTQFQIAGGEPLAGVKQVDVGVFAQDDWRFNPELTMSFGLRYENQSNISSNFNIAPRFGFAYAPGAGKGKSKTVFRGGVGIFYDRFGENLTLQANRFNGVNQQQFLITDPTILDTVVFNVNGTVSNVPSIASLSALPQTTRLVSTDLQVPYTIQSAFSVERQLPFKTTFSATFVNAQTNRMLRSRNINAPIGGVQPVIGGGTIYQYESTGKFRQNQLVINMRTNFMKNVSIYGNYSYGFANSDTDGAGTFPVNQYDFSGEYGDALQDIRQRFTIGANFTAPWGITLAPFITYRSGVPFNITTGVDSNGDTIFNERPSFATGLSEPGIIVTRFGAFDPTPEAGDTIIPRNYGRGPDFFQVNLRAAKTFGFGSRKTADTTSTAGSGRRGGGRGGRGGGGGGVFGGAGGQGGGGGSSESPYNLQFSINVRNIFNRVNFGNPVGNLSSQLFGQSLSSAGGFGFGGGGGGQAGNRRIEFGVSFSF
jgi:hypothetical protein